MGWESEDLIQFLSSTYWASQTWCPGTQFSHLSNEKKNIFLHILIQLKHVYKFTFCDLFSIFYF